MPITPAVLFDLDGTLVDTAPDLLSTMNTLLRHEGREQLEPAHLRKLIGRGARNLIAESFKATGAPLTPEQIETTFEAFIKDYNSHVAAESVPYPGVVSTLERLKADGVRMGVLTNKPHGPSVELLEQLGLTRFFLTICGQGKYPWMKPDPRVFAKALDSIGGGPAVMVGDSLTDVEAAHNSHAPVILVSYGYTTQPATTLGADVVLDDFCDVPAAALRLLGIS